MRSLKYHVCGLHEEYTLNLPFLLEVNNNVIELDITNKEYEDYCSQQTKCEICGRSVDMLSQTTKAGYLNVDHEHGTNHFRGLLCTNCNTKLGWFEKYVSPISLYLKKNIGQKINIKTE